jgi:hypothetical protein
MTLNEFEALAQVWGADIGRWPEHLRSAAEMLAGTSEAAAILADADHLDQLIAVARPAVSVDRADRAMSNVMTMAAGRGHRKAIGGILSSRWWLIPAVSIAGAAILGTSLGILKPLKTSTDRTVLAMVLDAGSFDPDWLLR